jgi:hypothetical protein
MFAEKAPKRRCCVHHHARRIEIVLQLTARSGFAANANVIRTYTPLTATLLDLIAESPGWLPSNH